MRTNIEIDSKLIETAMQLAGIETKKELVDKAIREFIESRTRRNLMDLKGIVVFDEGYDYKAERKTNSNGAGMKKSFI